MECQARICPICYDDHSPNAECNVQRLKWRLVEKQAEIERLRGGLERIKRINIDPDTLASDPLSAAAMCAAILNLLSPVAERYEGRHPRQCQGS